MKLTIEKIFENVITTGEALPLHFVPKNKDKMIKGLMLSTNIDVSLSFKSGTDLKYNQQTIFHGTQVAPNKRIMQLDEPLNENPIKGIVVAPPQSGEPQTYPASVYLIIEQGE